MELYIALFRNDFLSQGGTIHCTVSERMFESRRNYIVYIVLFRNDCLIQGGTIYIVLFRNDCLSQGGTAAGTCASGFGVCCLG